MPKVKDETGKRYGRLLVLEHVGPGPKKQAMWRCLCDCGAESVVSGIYLRSGMTRSCGCLRGHPGERAELRSQQFGRLVVLDYAGNHPQNQKAMWRCRCDCGVEVTIRVDCLRNGNTTSCGCYRAEMNLTRSVKDIVDYGGAHQRVSRARGGPASAYPCVDCGGTAQHWSYDGLDPDALWSEKVSCWYSLDTSHYVPRCVKCHTAHDRPKAS